MPWKKEEKENEKVNVFNPVSTFIQYVYTHGDLIFFLKPGTPRSGYLVACSMATHASLCETQPFN